MRTKMVETGWEIRKFKFIYCSCHIQIDSVKRKIDFSERPSGYLDFYNLIWKSEKKLHCLSCMKRKAKFCAIN